MQTGRRVVFMLAALLACAGCLTTPGVPRNGNAAPAPNGHGSNSTQLRPGLVINVHVLVSGKMEIDEKSRRIPDSGFITLPLVGEVLMANMTTREAQSMLKTLYSRYFVAPQVIVECLESSDVSPWGYVTVLGRVKKPGPVNLPPTRELTVIRAIQLAGGLDTSAKSKAIRVTRSNSNGTEHFEVDLDRIGTRGETKDDIQLMQGDVVYVPELIF